MNTKLILITPEVLNKSVRKNPFGLFCSVRLLFLLDHLRNGSRIVPTGSPLNFLKAATVAAFSVFRQFLVSVLVSVFILVPNLPISYSLLKYYYLLSPIRQNNHYQLFLPHKLSRSIRQAHNQS